MFAMQRKGKNQKSVTSILNKAFDVDFSKFIKMKQSGKFKPMITKKEEAR